ncbi:hypothetical protein ABZW44_30450 [Streptomyces mirabilis]|uniref:hypothetical protein n=1 Tax=Streptomyces mirabilis TaxID=68239 RepID=UPI0033B69396
MTPPSSGNLRFVLVADPGLPSEMARDLAPRLPEDLRRRIARGIRWQADTVTAPLVADESCPRRAASYTLVLPPGRPR